MKNYLTELIGTFFLVLTIGLTVLDHSAFAPLAIGSVLMVMVYMGGHVSGGHYNPAVSLAAAMRGALPGSQWLPYAVSQVVGALAAGLVVYLVRGETFAPEPGIGVSALSALIVEFVFTFALCLTVLSTATSKKVEGNSFYGLAIGFTVMVGAFAGGPISGGAFNPAVGLGPTIVHAMIGGGSLAHLWLYLVGPLLGGVVAALVFRIQDAGA
jgi:aquaporin Z